MTDFIPPDRVLRAIVTPYIPYVYPCAVAKKLDWKDCPNPGIDYELFDYIVRFLNITVDYVPMDQNEFTEMGNWGGMKEEGVFDGFLGMLKAKEVDTINTWFRYTGVRQTYFTFTTPISYGQNTLGFIIRKPDGLSAIAASELLYKVFQPMVWVGVLSTLLVTMLLMCWAPNFRRWADSRFKIKSVRDIDTSGCWNTLTMCLDQYHSENSTETVFGNIAMICAGFMILFAVTLYEGGLVGSLMTVSTDLPFRTTTQLAALVKKKQFFIVRDKGTGNVFFWDLLQKPEFEVHKRLNESLNHNPIIRIDNMEELHDRIEEDPTLAFPGQDLPGATPFIKRRCKIIFVQDEEATLAIPAGFIFPEGSPWPEVFSPVLSGLAPMIQYLENKYLKIEQNSDRKDCPAESKKEGDPLTLRHFYGIFMIACFMFVVSISAWIGEVGMTSFKARLMKRFTQRKAVIWAKTRTIGRVASAVSITRGKSIDAFHNDRLKTAAIDVEENVGVTHPGGNDIVIEAGMYRSLAPLRSTKY